MHELTSVHLAVIAVTSFFTFATSNLMEFSRNSLGLMILNEFSMFSNVFPMISNGGLFPPEYAQGGAANVPLAAPRLLPARRVAPPPPPFLREKRGGGGY